MARHLGSSSGSALEAFGGLASQRQLLQQRRTQSRFGQLSKRVKTGNNAQQPQTGQQAIRAQFGLLAQRQSLQSQTNQQATRAKFGQFAQRSQMSQQALGDATALSTTSLPSETGLATSTTAPQQQRSTMQQIVQKGLMANQQSALPQRRAAKQRRFNIGQQMSISRAAF